MAGFVSAIGQKETSSTTTSLVLTTTGAATIGKSILLAVRCASTRTVTVTDAVTNVWVVDKTTTLGTIRTTLCRTHVTHKLNSGGLITAHFSGTANAVLLTATVYTGITPTSPVDASGVAGATTGTAVTPVTSTATTHANDLIVSVGYVNSVTPTLTITSNYTRRTDFKSTDQIAVADRIVSATGTYTAKWTWLTTSTFNNGIIMAYKLAAAAHDQFFPFLLP